MHDAQGILYLNIALQNLDNAYASISQRAIYVFSAIYIYTAQLLVMGIPFFKIAFRITRMSWRTISSELHV